MKISKVHLHFIFLIKNVLILIRNINFFIYIKNAKNIIYKSALNQFINFNTNNSSNNMFRSNNKSNHYSNLNGFALNKELNKVNPFKD